eukprot:GHVP01041668.1.p1 GENE.GHVP01041668.1~~GHVP01041668.1.p1  ORF type:complete len:457 (-),score=49.58 GHVP01041668.1:289-1659(-)
MCSSICMVSDFYYPNTGGVENHIHNLSTELKKRGNNVIIVTHEYENCSGLIVLESGIRVYHLSHPVCYRRSIYPVPMVLAPTLLEIFYRERIEIVHGHHGLSGLAYSTIIMAKTMGLKTVFSEHSLFGLSKIGNIVPNAVMKALFADVDFGIAVSAVTRENLVVRVNCRPEKIFVIPNAINKEEFYPIESSQDIEDSNNEIYNEDKNISIIPTDEYKRNVRIIVVTRLYYRKGIDFLLSLIPIICKLEPNVCFTIAGYGPMKILLEQMIEDSDLEERVLLTSANTPDQVREVLNTGDIFLNTSLIEAFCIAIVEAASCGLLVVSTSVGGIPEVLDDEFIILSPPKINELIKAVKRGIEDIRNGRNKDRMEIHQKVIGLYSWEKVAIRTEKVYREVMLQRNKTIVERVYERLSSEFFSGLLFSFLLLIEAVFINILFSLRFIFQQEYICTSRASEII